MIITHVYDPKLWDIWFEGTPYNSKPKKRGTAKEWAATNKADVVYNLGFFNMSNFDTVTYVKAKGFDVGYGGSPERLTVSPGNVCGAEADDKNGKKWGVGIKDNVVVEPSGGDARSRNGIGITPTGKIIIAQSTNKVTRRSFCTSVATQIKNYYKDTVKIFLMEDGGGSTQSYSNFSKLTIAPEGGRKVPTVTCVKLRVPLKLTKTMRTGSKGEDVRLLQMVLGGLECDGSYGNATKARVKAAQKALKIAQDGSCGPITLKALGLG